MKISILIFSIFLIYSCCNTKNTNSNNKVDWVKMEEPFMARIPDSLKFLINEFSVMMNDDQRYRSVQDPDLYNKNFKKQEILDSINENKLFKIVKKYGWMNDTFAGMKVMLSKFSILQHCSLSFQEKIYPLIRQIAINNETKLYFKIAMLEDRINVNNNIPQRFGTQLDYHSKTKKYYLNPLLNVDSVNKWRHEMGLIPLEDYLMKNFDYKFSIEEYKRNIPEMNKMFNFKNDSGVYYKNPLPSFIKIDSNFAKFLN